MAKRYELSDRQWERICALVPGTAGEEPIGIDANRERRFTVHRPRHCEARSAAAIQARA